MVTIADRRLNNPAWWLCRFAGYAFIAFGVGFIAFCQWYYSSSRTIDVDVPINLDKPNYIDTGFFEAHFSGIYSIGFEFDRKIPATKFSCLAGDSIVPEACYYEPPELQINWAVTENGKIIDRGKSGLDEWRKTVKNVIPEEASRFRTASLKYSATHPQSASEFPYTFEPSTFYGVQGRIYSVKVWVSEPAKTLAALNPRLQVYYSGSNTEGYGVLILAISAFSILIGAAVVLLSRSKRRFGNEPS